MKASDGTEIRIDTLKNTKVGGSINDCFDASNSAINLGYTAVSSKKTSVQIPLF